MSAESNRLTSTLGEICSDDPSGEKWILAPSLRVGIQWLDLIARSGRPVLNARVKTMRQMALELALPEMDRAGLSFLRGERAELLIDRIIGRVRNRGKGYLSELETGPGLTRTVQRALKDLRLAGISSEMLVPGSFEVEAKGKEMASLLREYEEALDVEGLIDAAGVFEMAIGVLNGRRAPVPGEALVMIPEDFLGGLAGLERALWEALPKENLRVLPVDGPGGARSTDARLLGMVLDPPSAGLPADDGTAGIFRAVGEVNEVREVFRRCAAKGLPLDEVEIVHTDGETYPTIVYELTNRMAPVDGEIPVTFLEGVPVRYSRPARAILGILSWAGEEYPQSVLERMIGDGLLEAGTESPGLPGPASLLRSLPIGYGRDRYLTVMDRRIGSIEGSAASGARPQHSAPRGSSVDGDRRRLKGLKALRELVADLLGLDIEGKAGQVSMLRSAIAFLQTRARCEGKLDEYARGFLLERMEERADCLERDGEVPGRDAGEWIRDLALSSNVLGQGPRPGRAFVSPLHSGGHSGRGHTFIVGLDDSRFPGTGAQDPLLLDGERERISQDLKTGTRSLAGRLEEFALLVSRLRGNVTLSYSCRSLIDDREVFPSPVVVSAYRILSGNRAGDQGDLAAWLPDPVSFAPGSAEECIDSSELWLHRLCEGPCVECAREAVAGFYPNLRRGFEAGDARESDAFTEFDGYVPEAGADNDPASARGGPLSSRMLEMLARCPMDYFFTYVLGIKTPDEYEMDPGVWLDRMERGLIIHDVFREFLRRLDEDGCLPDYGEHRGLLEEIVTGIIEEWSARRPPPSSDVFEVEEAEIRRTARVFLRSEQVHCELRRPRYFEVAVGVKQEKEGTAIDSSEPVALELPDGRTVSICGRLDRVDELPGEDNESFEVWDYKTGRSAAFDRLDPFKQGRHLQCAIYLLLAESALQRKHPGARVVASGYFFPSLFEGGARIRWGREQLEGCLDILTSLCDMLAGGCFNFSCESTDARWSTCVEAFGDVEVAAGAASRKITNAKNKALEPFRRLRGM